MSNEASVQTATPQYVYLARSEGDAWKIGWSMDPELRLQSLGAGQPYTVTLVHQIETPLAGWLESYLHYRFKSKRIRGEWFRLRAKDVAYIRGLDAPAVARLAEANPACAVLRSREEPITQSVQADVEPPLAEALNRLAKEWGQSKRHLITAALTQYLAGRGYWPPAAALVRVVGDCRGAP